MERLPKGLEWVDDRQHGLVTSEDVRAAGHWPNKAYARIAAGVWRRVHPGVYLANAAEPTLKQRVWAALLYVGPRAMLSYRSAAWASGMVSRLGDVVHVTVPHRTTVNPTPGIQVHRTRRRPVKFANPWRTEIHETVLDLCEAADSDDEILGWIADGVRSGASTSLLRSRLAKRSRFRGRARVLEFLTEAQEGIESPMELRYRRDVLIAHGLPVGEHQVRGTANGRRHRSDWREAKFGVRVELDGLLGHSNEDVIKDATRDNDIAATTGDITLRFRWRHIIDPCSCARQVAGALRQRGWRGEVQECGPGCGVGC